MQWTTVGSATYLMVASDGEGRYGGILWHAIGQALDEQVVDDDELASLVTGTFLSTMRRRSAA